MSDTQAGGPLSLSTWQGLMGRDLAKAHCQPLQAALFADGIVKLYAGALCHRLSEGTPLGLVARDGRAVIESVEDGVPSRQTFWQDEDAVLDVPVPDDVAKLLSAAGSESLLLVDDGSSLALLPLDVEEHDADVLGPRVIDQIVRGDGGVPVRVVRHVVRGPGYDEWTDERLQKLQDVVTADRFTADPMSEITSDEGWVGVKTRLSITGAATNPDVRSVLTLRNALFAGQNPDGSWGGTLLRTAYATLNALTLGVTPDDKRLKKAAEWLVELPELEGRPGMWALRPSQAQEWNAIKRGETKTERESFLDDAVEEREIVYVRSERQQRVWPTCARHYTGLCDAILHGSAIAAYALGNCGFQDHPRVQKYARSMLQMEGMFGYFCACWGPNDFEHTVNDVGDGTPDFNQRPDNHTIALAAVPYRYGRDASDLRPLARLPHFPQIHRPDLADCNGWWPYEWREMDVEDHYALDGAYWQNADCWARTNRALSAITGWAGSVSEFSGLFQCHLYQTHRGIWEQGFPVGMLRQLDALTRQSRAASRMASDAARFAKMLVLKTVPWLVHHQKADGTWHHGSLDCHRGCDTYPVPSARLTTYHIASVLRRFGVLKRCVPAIGT